jgi:hypothetical protein
MRDRADALARHVSQVEELAAERLAHLTSTQRRERELEEAKGDLEDELSIIKGERQRAESREQRAESREQRAENAFIISPQKVCF